MKYHVRVYILKGMVEVDVDAKNQNEAEQKATKEVIDAEAGFHGNYPNSDKMKYLAVTAEK